MAITPRLDLLASAAKVARARVHHEALLREIPSVLEKRKPYRARVGDIELRTGWCSVFLTPGDFSEYGLGVIVGDLVHNLRSALDYIVTALVDASHAPLGNKHQFPIYSNELAFSKDVATPQWANRKGPLAGILHGLQDVWDVQPFNRKPTPEEDPLFLLNRFSNADKHRATAGYMPMLNAGGGQLIHSGDVVEQAEMPPLTDWEANREYEVGRVRFAPPYPPEVLFDAEISVDILFGTPAFGKYSVGHAVDVQTLQRMCDHVATVVDHFQNL